MMRAVFALIGLIGIATVARGVAVDATQDAPAKTPTYAAAEAKAHVGTRATVCGKIAGGTYRETGRQPTFLDFDKPYPDRVFMALIWGSDRAKFGTPETTLKGKQVCVTGTIQLYQEFAQIVLEDPHQLVVKDEAKK
jgi:hypothetical protein